MGRDEAAVLAQQMISGLPSGSDREHIEWSRGRTRRSTAAKRNVPYPMGVAIFHRATITPTKAEVIGAYRFDDPPARVGMESHLVAAGGTRYQIPLTYRDEPLDGAEGRSHH
jgi:hypothetical protein